MRVTTIPALALMLLLPGPTMATGDCDGSFERIGQCNVDGSLGDGAAVLTGSASGSGSTGSGGVGTGSGSVSPDPACVPVLNDRCRGVGPGRTDPPADPVSLDDVAHFRPVVPVDVMEPDGWMIVGLDTNFFANSSRHVRDGTLLGQAASVRFTPVSWYWEYGDGTTRSSSTPGASWASLRVGEFDPTATSHAYEAAGTYYIDLTVWFTVEYRFAGGNWIPIAGQLPVPANRLVATAGHAKTVLVDHDCITDPAGPGC